MGWPETEREGGQDRLGYAFGVVADIIVPEAQDVPAAPVKKGGTRVVIFDTINMLAAVEFNGELYATAGEIKDVGAYR